MFAVDGHSFIYKKKKKELKIISHDKKDRSNVCGNFLHPTMVYKQYSEQNDFGM